MTDTLVANTGDQRSTERFERLTELSPSAKFVYSVLHREGTLTQDEITEQTLLPKRTVRYALDKLSKGDLVEAKCGVKDARTRRYSALPVKRTNYL